MLWTKQSLWKDYMRKTPFIYPHSAQTLLRSITRIITQTFHLRKISPHIIKVSGKWHWRVLTKARKAQIWPVLLTAALYRFCTWLFRAPPASHTAMALHIKTEGISGSWVHANKLFSYVMRILLCAGKQLLNLFLVPEKNKGQNEKQEQTRSLPMKISLSTPSFNCFSFLLCVAINNT